MTTEQKRHPLRDDDWTANDPAPPRIGTYDRAGVTAHIYDQHRCIFCNTNDLDDDIYGPFPCVEREPHTYTTETGDPPVFDPDEAERRAWFDDLLQSIDDSSRGARAEP